LLGKIYISKEGVKIKIKKYKKYKKNQFLNKYFKNKCQKCLKIKIQKNLYKIQKK
jgi:hypothetical protein